MAEEASDVKPWWRSEGSALRSPKPGVVGALVLSLALQNAREDILV